MNRAVVALVLAPAVASAQPSPALDEFFERTRARADGLEDRPWFVRLLAGVETATPRAQLATGGHLGVEAGVRDAVVDIARIALWGDVLRVDSTGDWITDLAGQATAFSAFEHLHVSLDAVAARRTYLEPSDAIAVQRDPYGLVDTELEVAPIGPKVDKHAHLAFPIGVAHRARWSLTDGTTSHRTSVSGAIALRGIVRERRLRTHAQLDVLRVKYVAQDRASTTSISAGYQRLPVGLDTLPLWALVGYQWAGDRSLVTAQLGMDLTYRGVQLAPSFQRHLELDPATSMVTRVTAGRMALRYRGEHVVAGASYEVASIEGADEFHAVTPEVGVAFAGFELTASYRLLAYERFGIALDRRF